MTICMKDTALLSYVNPLTSGRFVSSPDSFTRIETVADKKFTSFTLSALVTVFAAAWLGLAPMPSRAAEYAPVSLQGEKPASENDASQCSLVRSSLLASCTTTGLDRVAHTTGSMRTEEGNDPQGTEHSDGTQMLEDLVGAGVRRF